jgi:hypothetical protein
MVSSPVSWGSDRPGHGCDAKSGRALAARLAAFAETARVRSIGKRELAADEHAQASRIDTLGQLRQHGAARRREDERRSHASGRGALGRRRHRRSDEDAARLIKPHDASCIGPPIVSSTTSMSRARSWKRSLRRTAFMGRIVRRFMLEQNRAK